MNRRAWVTRSCLGDIKSSWSKWYMIRDLKDNLEVIINADDNTSWAFTVSGAIVCALHVWYQLFYCLDSSSNQFRIQVLTLACFLQNKLEKRGVRLPVKEAPNTRVLWLQRIGTWVIWGAERKMKCLESYCVKCYQEKDLPSSHQSVNMLGDRGEKQMWTFVF